VRRHLVVKAALTAVMMVSTAQAQQARRAVAEGDAPQTSADAVEHPLFDDDGGRVFVVGRDAGALAGLRYHGGAVISEPRQYNIFLGGAWSEPGLRRREAAFSNLLSQAGAGEGQLSLEGYGVRNVYAPSESQEQAFDFPVGGTVSDLQIRAALEGMFRAGAIRGPDADTVYVVFLPPGVGSKLGEMLGGKHYAAYHNFFHAEQGEVHYAVVVFEPQSKVAAQAAARALLEAALNPTGNGWY
jgi:hypothetical protein